MILIGKSSIQNTWNLECWFQFQ